MSARRISCPNEGQSAEIELIYGDDSRRTAYGFVLGGILSGAIWVAAGLVAWLVVA